MRSLFPWIAIAAVVGLAAASVLAPGAAWGFLVVGPLVALGIADMVQTRHAVRRNFPLIGWGRYLLEEIRPEIHQYFIEGPTDGKPFGREARALVYQRAKGALDTLPFGTLQDVYAVGYEWMNHSLAPRAPLHDPPRVLVGGETCAAPYAASLLNVSAMSFGALSSAAVRSLSHGARAGGFALNTGEGGISRYHLEGGCDLIWQIGTGYFGCRTADGRFDADAFAKQAALDAVRMIEVKLSQGAKPGHGGILPAAKLTPEIAEIRGVPLGRDVLSPPSHSSFRTPVELLRFVARLRELSGGKPVGFKLCVGKRREFLAITKAMVETGLHPDYIAVDGGEGGTGAAPLEFSNTLGCPTTDALVFVHNALVGVGFRERVRVFATGKIASGFDMARSLAIGADVCYAARSMMLALGCIQARRCNANKCPVGVTAHRPWLVAGLVVEDKAPRVTGFHRETIESLLELVAAQGMSLPSELRPWHVMRRIDRQRSLHYGEIYEYLRPGALLEEPVPERFARAWHAARPDSFDRVDLDV